ncbi:hypothetical protein [Fluviispira sanaruensis]|uniref:Transposase n=1 Tax=Fluviispira sanaruensis TaxID=2493639 RepID=A0A4V0P229_FLUSA|nr:hypothetical protein [Fluviispira sanaruensis]BBH51787.1 hypothetical protein JCM31447_02050 [Fluviispira sanaruensis]
MQLKRFSAEFKSKTALEKLKEQNNNIRNSHLYQVYPNKVYTWKNYLMAFETYL